MDIREKLVDYFRRHSREGDCSCEEYQNQMYELADKLIAIFKEFIETLELPEPCRNNKHLGRVDGSWECACREEQRNMVKSIIDKLEAKDG